MKVKTILHGGILTAHIDKKLVMVVVKLFREI